MVSIVSMIDRILGKISSVDTFLFELCQKFPSSNKDLERVFSPKTKLISLEIYRFQIGGGRTQRVKAEPTTDRIVDGFGPKWLHWGSCAFDAFIELVRFLGPWNIPQESTDGLEPYLRLLNSQCFSFKAIDSKTASSNRDKLVEIMENYLDPEAFRSHTKYGEWKFGVIHLIDAVFGGNQSWFGRIVLTCATCSIAVFSKIRIGLSSQFITAPGNATINNEYPRFIAQQIKNFVCPCCKKGKISSLSIPQFIYVDLNGKTTPFNSRAFVTDITLYGHLFRPIVLVMYDGEHFRIRSIQPDKTVWEYDGMKKDGKYASSTPIVRGSYKVVAVIYKSKAPLILSLDQITTLAKLETEPVVTVDLSGDDGLRQTEVATTINITDDLSHTEPASQTESHDSEEDSDTVSYDDLKSKPLVPRFAEFLMKQLQNGLLLEDQIKQEPQEIKQEQSEVVESTKTILTKSKSTRNRKIQSSSPTTTMVLRSRPSAIISPQIQTGRYKEEKMNREAWRLSTGFNLDVKHVPLPKQQSTPVFKQTKTQSTKRKAFSELVDPKTKKARKDWMKKSLDNLRSKDAGAFDAVVGEVYQSSIPHLMILNNLKESFHKIPKNSPARTSFLKDIGKGVAPQEVADVFGVYVNRVYAANRNSDAFNL